MQDICGKDNHLKTCVNKDGGYDCLCKDGYMENNNGSCSGGYCVFLIRNLGLSESSPVSLNFSSFRVLKFSQEHLNFGKCWQIFVHSAKSFLDF